MNQSNPKRRAKPTDVCQYTSKCYRKNPHHFMEYAHEHLDKVIDANKERALADYKLPDELKFTRQIALDQIKIILDLFPLDREQPSTKKEKLESEPTERANKIVTNSSVENSSKEEKKTSDEKPLEKPSNEASTSGRSAAKSVGPNIHDFIQVVLPKGKMAEKLAHARPYNYFLTAITSSLETHREPLTITFQEIFDSSLGEVESSVQINFMVDVGWLLGHYHFAGCLNKPLLILYGSEMPELKTISQKKPQVIAEFVKMGNPFATHHTKVMLIGYKDQSMRVVVSTANLYEDDWHNRTQGLWISEKLEAMADAYDTASGESPTGFRNDLLRYLTSYNSSNLQPWLARIRRTDFRSVNVFLVSSVPGTHHESGSNGYPHGHARVAHLLSKYAPKIPEESSVVAQSSSLGSFGTNAGVWLTSEFLNSLRRDKESTGIRTLPPFKLIYPSFNNVMDSHDGLIGGGCLPYGNQTHQKQPWLTQYLYQWKANARHRTHAMPHIKTYSRWTTNKLHWFLLTSANVSKAAWGSFNKSAKINTPIRINNYEVGVLFLPKFVTNTEYFSLDESDQTTVPFPKVYDIPLTKYAIDDTPFLSDILFDQ